MASKVAKGMIQTRPLLSSDVNEARRRVKQLFKSCYRYIPYMLYQYDVPITQKEAEEKLKQRFRENAHITDVRVIDILIMKVISNIESAMATVSGKDIKILFKPFVQFRENKLQGQMELDEVMEHWMGNMHVMKFYKDTIPEKPSDFLSKFYQGVD